MTSPEGRLLRIPLNHVNPTNTTAAVSLATKTSLNDTDETLLFYEKKKIASAQSVHLPDAPFKSIHGQCRCLASRKALRSQEPKASSKN